MSLVPVDSAHDLGADIVIAVDVTAVETQEQTSGTNKLPTLNSLSSVWGFMENSIAAQPKMTPISSCLCRLLSLANLPFLSALYRTTVNAIGTNAINASIANIFI